MGQVYSGVGTGFSLGVMKMFWSWMVVGAAQECGNT